MQGRTRNLHPKSASRADFCNQRYRAPGKASFSGARKRVEPRLPLQKRTASIGCGSFLDSCRRLHYFGTSESSQSQGFACGKTLERATPRGIYSGIGYNLKSDKRELTKEIKGMNKNPLTLKPQCQGIPCYYLVMVSSALVSGASSLISSTSDSTSLLRFSSIPSFSLTFFLARRQ